ncbi:MAG: hypothetical protein CVV44_07965 [Spirochaetae bacterium HGW-Spirochaetae-1]|nr:MAG: hypothetical protein CVV44_07965 [Spirochaetae bacterium HGW-Spirochaetae-1]
MIRTSPEKENAIISKKARIIERTAQVLIIGIKKLLPVFSYLCAIHALYWQNCRYIVKGRHVTNLICIGIAEKSVNKVTFFL